MIWSKIRDIWRKADASDRLTSCQLTPGRVFWAAGPVECHLFNRSNNVHLSIPYSFHPATIAEIWWWGNCREVFREIRKFTTHISLFHKPFRANSHFARPCSAQSQYRVSQNLFYDGIISTKKFTLRNLTNSRELVASTPPPPPTPVKKTHVSRRIFKF